MTPERYRIHRAQTGFQPELYRLTSSEAQLSHTVGQSNIALSKFKRSLMSAAMWEARGTDAIV